MIDKTELYPPDFILVLPEDIRDKRFHLKYISYVINYLHQRGITFYITRGVLTKDYFVRLRFPAVALEHYANVYNIDISSQGHYYLPVGGIPGGIFKTPLSDNRDIFKRRNGLATTSERIQVAIKLLKDARFSPEEENRGINTLLKLGVLKMAYPLHDGEYIFNPNQKDSELNDRQLLLKYWANLRVWYKKQPLNLIEKYFGTDIAYYFAWFGFYNMMLIPASVFGVLCFIYSVISVSLGNDAHSREVCASKMKLCPICLDKFHECLSREVRQTCFYAKLTAVFDNDATLVFSLFMSLWSNLFILLWKRTESILRLRWNVDYLDRTVKLRSAYLKEATQFKKSKVTGRQIRRIPFRKFLRNNIISHGVVIVVTMVIIITMLAIAVARIYLKNWVRESAALQSNPYVPNYDAQLFFTMIFFCVVQVLFSKLFEAFVAPLAIWLTKIENPRTSLEFDSSVIYKRYFLAFVNNFMPLFYIAFIMEKFYFPQNKEVDSLADVLSVDVCTPSSCLASLCIQLFFYIFMKQMVGNIFMLQAPVIMAILRKCYREVTAGKNKVYATKIVQRYEVERSLSTQDQHELATDFMEMIIQFGFVTFFVCAFPLAPLCALFNNCIELRLDARKYVVTSKRPIPRKVDGIGAWNNILNVVAYSSTAINAFVLAFTSDIVNRMIYYYTTNKHMKGYSNFTLSVYDPTDQIKSENLSSDTLADYNSYNFVCYYKGSRYGPKAREAYLLSEQFVNNLGMKLVAAVVFEHVVLLFRVIVKAYVPEVPLAVKELKNIEMNLERDLEIRKYEGKQRRSGQRGPRIRSRNRPRNASSSTVAIRRRRF